MLWFFWEWPRFTFKHLHTFTPGSCPARPQSSTICLRGVPLELVGINCLAQGHFNGNCEGRWACFSLTSLSRFSQPFGKTELATSVISFLVCWVILSTSVTDAPNLLLYNYIQSCRAWFWSLDYVSKIFNLRRVPFQGPLVKGLACEDITRASSQVLAYNIFCDTKGCKKYISAVFSELSWKKHSFCLHFYSCQS